MTRRLTAATAAVLAVLALAGPATAFSKQDATVTSFDGTPLATTLFLPDAAPPAGGWPAVVLFHGLGGDRGSMNTLAQAMGLVGERYAVLTVDARGHGASGGLTSIDGPNEQRDVQALFAWLAARPDVADARIGAFGISLGGGAVWTSLVAGVPWAAVEVAESWTDIRTALTPQGVAKSGVIAGLVAALPAARIDPSVIVARDAAFAGTPGPVAAFAAPRSTIGALGRVRTPVLLMQGRRDFVFGIDQALQAYRALAGPKRLWLGLHGHTPSSFPAADSTAMLAEGAQWFDRYLRSARTSLDDKLPVAIAPENWGGRPVRFAALPKATTTVRRLPGSTAIGAEGKVQRRTAALPATEVYGAPVVTVTANANAGWKRLVAVLAARTPAGKTIVVGAGGVPAKPGSRTYRIRLSDQVTFLPAGSRLTVTLASSSTAQDPKNVLYLDLPLGPSPRVVIGDASLTLPALAKPVSR